MTPVLENSKQLIVKKDKVICKAKVTPANFKNVESVTNPARFFVYEPEFVGVATLKDGDTDNVREAIHIAESKMERQYYKYILSHFKAEKTMLENTILPEINAMIEKNSKNIESINNHILDIVDSMD
jgi:hypothetical protein